jgi:uncharacterized RDD family membrane protein YckC
MALVKCSECQSQVSDKAVSCPHCGNVFTRCPECATEVRPGAATCGNCGHPLTLAPTPQASSASQSTSQPLADNTQYFGAAVAPVVYAGFWRRFAAAIIDSIIVLVVLVVLDLVLAQIVSSTSTAFTALSSVLSIGIGVAYYVGQESSTQQATIGKRALGIIVTDMFGNRVSTGRATGRYFGKIVSGLTLLIGYLMAAFTEKKQALHDMMAGTLVVVKPTSR